MIVDVRTLPVHFTSLKMIGVSPAHYRHAAAKPWDVGTLAQRMGRASHAATFEPHLLVEYKGGDFADKKGKVKTYSSVKNGACWEAFKASQSPDAVIVNAKELDRANAIAAALRNHDIAGPILFGHGVEHEQTILWDIDGRACSSKPDARHRGVMIGDLKTCRSAQPDRFVRDALWAYYHAQLRFYDRADAHETGRTVWDPQTRRGDKIDLYAIAVESAAPHVVTVFELDDTAIVAADRAIGMWWARLVSCEAENAWHGYSQCVVPFTCDDPENFLPTLTESGEPENDNTENVDDDNWSAA